MMKLGLYNGYNWAFISWANTACQLSIYIYLSCSSILIQFHFLNSKPITVPFIYFYSTILVIFYCFKNNMLVNM